MAPNDYDFYMWHLNSLSQLHSLIDPQEQEDTRKRHWLNDFLGFGFSKEDIVLPKLIDQWTDPNRIALSTFLYWVEHKLYPFVAHNDNILEKRKHKNTLIFLSGQVEKIIKTTDIQNRGEHFITNVDELKATIVIITMYLECKSIRDLGENFNGYGSWETRWGEIIDRNNKTEKVCPEIIKLLKETAALYP